MDQGVIRSFKAHYQKRVVRKLIKALGKNASFPKVYCYDYAEACNFTKIKIPPWVFFTFFKLYKWYQIVQRTTYKAFVRHYLDYGEILYDQAFNMPSHQKLESIQYNSSLAMVQYEVPLRKNFSSN